MVETLLIVKTLSMKKRMDAALMGAVTMGIAVLSLLLGGCSVLSPRLGSLSSGTHALINYDFPPFSVDLHQQLHTQSEGEPIVLTIGASLQPDAARFVLLDAYGQRLATVSYRDDEVLWEQSRFVSSVGFDLEVFSLIYPLAFWPEPAIQSQLNPQWRVDFASTHRTVYKENTVVADIQYSAECEYEGRVDIHIVKNAVHFSILNNVLNKGPNITDINSGCV
ncbi:DUF3261 domain-containing protein [Marinibactrum halimedae]|uniref:DUF3261 domain-containing protein n=1 Tax=Marinibactrum halimedae TaxID=1444977 RepID=A0AA37T562_9GAMM|nr:DUF3261 domain-containing protein [Marinibactrum halimedae]MCD9460441.1 DUF3261 domain-containing protein [Marinibactrum halimedae]GLS27428.1 hypothetical protein GCM10007877_31470 [Marinibactrum halimedae]